MGRSGQGWLAGWWRTDHSSLGGNKLCCIAGIPVCHVMLIVHFLTPSVLRRVFLIFILRIIWRFSTGSETRVGIKIVQTRAINLLTLIDSS